MSDLLPALTDPPRCGCLNCPPRPIELPLDAQPHPGFGGLYLTRDGETPEWWDEFCAVSWDTYFIDKGWQKLTRYDGSEVDYFDGDWFPCWAVESVTLAEIEECVAECEDGDWRLKVDAPLGDVTYQRHGPGRWVAVERGQGFA